MCTPIFITSNIVPLNTLYSDAPKEVNAIYRVRHSIMLSRTHNLFLR